MIPLSVPTVTGDEIKYLERCIGDGWLSTAGPMVDEFEARLAERAGRAHAVAVASGTAALHLGLISVGVKPGEIVLTQAFSFIATANAVVHAGAVPVFIDSDPDTWNMSVVELEKVLAAAEVRDTALYDIASGRRIAAVMPALVYGLCGDISGLCAVARKYGLPLVSDAAEAVGATWDGVPAEKFGETACVSFNGNKVMTCGGGGAILTDDLDIARLCRHLSTQAKADAVNHLHDHVGYNYRMPAINAAVGLAQLDNLDAFLARKGEIHARYVTAIQGLPGVTAMPLSDRNSRHPWLFSLTIDGLSSGDAVKVLEAKGVGARRLWRPLDRQAVAYGDANGETKASVANGLYEVGISLPSSVTMSDDDQEQVIEALKSVING